MVPIDQVSAAGRCCWRQVGCMPGLGHSALVSGLTESLSRIKSKRNFYLGDHLRSYSISKERSVSPLPSGIDSCLGE